MTLEAGGEMLMRIGGNLDELIEMKKEDDKGVLKGWGEKAAGLMLGGGGGRGAGGRGKKGLE